MGNCRSLPKNSQSGGRKLTLAILGLDNAGKTVTAKGLQGAPLDTVAPTIGFSSVEFKFNKQDIVLYDLGGGKKIRDIWKNYFAEVYGLIYVVDSSEPDRMQEARSVLHNLLQHPKVAGKPILLLGNKQDCPGALDEIDICDALDLEEAVNLNKCPCRLETCTAIEGKGKKLDKSIHNGFEWLLGVINDNYEKLTLRIETESGEQKQREAKEREERAERVKKAREQREREREERGEVSDMDEVDDPGTNPFKPLSIKDIQKKEDELRSKKQLQKSQRAVESDDEVYSRNSRPLTPTTMRSKEDYDYPSHRLTSSKSSHTRVLPPIDRTPRSKSYSDSDNSDGDGYHDNKMAKSPWLNRKGLGDPRAPSPPLSRALGGLYDNRFGRDTKRAPATLSPLASLQPIESEDTKKKKKKKAKKNQTVPVDDDDDEEDKQENSHGDGGPRGWSTPPGQRSLLRASRSPRLTTLQEPENGEDIAYSSSFSHRFGLEDGLPQLAPVRRGTQPNSEFDNGLMT